VKVPSPRALSLVSGRQDLLRQVPDPTINPHVFRDRCDCPRPGPSPARRPVAQPSSEQVLLNLIEAGPQVVSDILHPTASQELCRQKSALRGVREAYRQRSLGKLDLLVLLKLTSLHALDLASQDAKPLGNLECAGDHFLNDVAPMSHPDRRKRSHRDY
jgi:hypothetical protein